MHAQLYICKQQTTAQLWPASYTAWYSNVTETLVSATVTLELAQIKDHKATGHHLFLDLGLQVKNYMLNSIMYNDPPLLHAAFVLW